jgi:hypothetical protein
MDFSPTAKYARKESSQFGQLCLLHCTYHQTLVDLYRIGMPKLFKIRAVIDFPPEQRALLQQIQHSCFFHARQVAIIIRETAVHGIRMLADTWMSVIAHDSIKVMLYYLTEGRLEKRQALLDQTIPLFQSTVEALNAMIPMFATAKGCVR